MIDLVEYCRPQIYLCHEWCGTHVVEREVKAHSYREAARRLGLRAWYGLRHVGPVKAERVGR